jgi:hypothetical protein
VGGPWPARLGGGGGKVSRLLPIAFICVLPTEAEIDAALAALAPLAPEVRQFTLYV